MQGQDSKLLSKLSLLIPENDFHARMHESGPNSSFYYHYHDYYEITFYLGEQDAIYLKGDVTYTIHKGDIIFCRMLSAISSTANTMRGICGLPSASNPES